MSRRRKGGVGGIEVEVVVGGMGLGSPFPASPRGGKICVSSRRGARLPRQNMYNMILGPNPSFLDNGVTKTLVPLVFTEFLATPPSPIPPAPIKHAEVFDISPNFPDTSAYAKLLLKKTGQVITSYQNIEQPAFTESLPTPPSPSPKLPRDLPNRKKGEMN